MLYKEEGSIVLCSSGFNIQGLTSQQIKDLLVLENAPSHYCIVNVPAGTEMYVGLINNSSVPGSIQYELLKLLPVDCYGIEYILP